MAVCNETGVSWYQRNRERVLAGLRERYHSDPARRKVLRERSRQRYHKDATYAEKVKAGARRRWAERRAAAVGYTLAFKYRLVYDPQGIFEVGRLFEGWSVQAGGFASGTVFECVDTGEQLEIRADIMGIVEA